MRAWALLSKLDGRVWESNEGYPDVLGSTYVYDSGVANHLQVTVGDMVILRDSTVVHGVSRIDYIDSGSAVKVRFVCPKCRRTGQAPRKTKGSEYLCRRCRNEFDEPFRLEVPITRYVASYGAQWQPLDGALSFGAVESLLDRARQNAIRKCDLDGLIQVLEGLSVPVPALPAPRVKSPRGGRREALVRVRHGQKEFREALLERYQVRCAVTGPCPAKVLQAAHLRAFAVHESHNLDEGLLLRSDLHQLFDAGLMAVDPATRSVVLAPSMDGYPDYQKLVGTVIADGPYMAALADHHAEATAAW
ncbi:HNH endonuclease [Nocardia arizonensis]|uniref:HNH endonuclease n=1 Tax=Nocardia arizonensis TaxID=1141647 RepID=UPI000A93FC43|nr:HNH endonuclease [Nocardia arizonensis]